MNQKIIYSYLIIFLFALGVMISCKSEKPETQTAEAQDVSAKTTLGKTEKPSDTVKSKYLDVVTGVDSIDLSDSLNNVQIESADEKMVTESSPKAKNEASKKGNSSTKKKIIKKQPKIEFEELVWDFGEIIEGDVVEKKFKFTNTGDAPLEIIATSATCGCTRPSFPFLPIAPGESNVIGVNYNSVGKEGVQNPEVTIESNTIPKTTTIKLQGIVKPKLKKEENKTTLANDSIKVGQ